MMQKIAHWTMTHRRIGVAAWIVGGVGVFAHAGAVGKKTAESYRGLFAGAPPTVALSSLRGAEPRPLDDQREAV